MLSEPQKEGIQRLAVEHGWRMVVLFGSSVRGDGRDVDIAVMPAGWPDLFAMGRWQSQLEALFAPKPVDLLILDDAISPTARFQVMKYGMPLYEDEPGIFSREIDRAFFLYADSEKFRRLRHEDLHARRT